MLHTSITSLEETPALIAMAACAVLTGCVIMMVRGASTAARRTATAVGLALVALSMMLEMVTGQVMGGNTLLSDIGMNVAVMGMATLLCSMGALDRARTPGLMLFALGATASFAHYVQPLLLLLLPAQPIAATLYMLCIAACMMHLVLISTLPLGTARFSAKGERRVEASAGIAHEAWVGCLIAAALTALLWRMKAYEGVNTSFHIYASMLAAVTTSVVAAFITYRQRAPAALNIALLALPAGVLSVGLLQQATPIDVIVMAGCTGAAVALTRDALLALRIDEPSHSIACIMIPAIMGFAMPGIMELSQLAAKIQWLGALIASAVLLGYAWRMLCQLTLGLSLSRRASEEGLDTVYAVASARR